MEHSEQKFRLSYILGPNPVDDEEDEDSDDVKESEEQTGDIDNSEREENRANLVRRLNRCDEIANRIIRDLEDEVGESAVKMSEKDKDAFLQLVSDELIEDEDVQSLVDEVIDAIEVRFQFVSVGSLDCDSSGWPIRWRYQADAESRSEFLRQVRWFASNYSRFPLLADRPLLKASV